MIRSRLRALRPRIARRFRKRIFDRGVDATATITAGRALILAPHADDEAIGCGIVIARKAAAGTDVTIVIATDGRNGRRALDVGSDELARLRRLEAIEAAQAFGLKPDAVRFLDFVDGTLDANRGPLRDALVQIAAEVRPDEIYIPNADHHLDHQTLSEVARAAFKDGDARVYEYLIRYWVRVPWVIRPPGTLRRAYGLVVDPIREWRRQPAMLVRADEYRDQKLAALAAYAGEMQNIGHFVYEFADTEYEAFFHVN